ncbi:hypothetical protein PM082_006188 [Marasmius tenuissimus]|nr:hypothetical protein PM082_006188 [Marasmius tenuissimus]
MEEKYAPPDHPVFHLTPPAFHSKAQYFLTTCLASPEVTFESFWTIYEALLGLFKGNRATDANLTCAIADCFQSDQEIHGETMDLLQGQKELLIGGKVVNEAKRYVEEVDLFEGAFFHDEENYLLVDFSDEEVEQDARLEEVFADFTDEEEMEVEQSLLG